MFTLTIESNKYIIQDKLLTLDKIIDNKNIEFDLSKSDDSFKIYLTKYFLWKSYMINYIFLSEYNISLYNCYFTHNNNIVSLKFDTAAVGIETPNIDLQKTNTVYAKIIYKDYNMGDFEELTKQFESFNINQYHFDLSINFIPRYCIIKLSYSKEIKISTLNKEFMNFFEFISFITGCSFELKKLYYNVKNQEICKILNLNSKFDKNKKNLYTNKILIDTIDFKKSYITWKNLRQKSHLIFDLYFNSIHSFNFTEVSLALLLNCMEGYMKTIHMTDILKTLPNIKLDTILENTYFCGTNSKKVMKLSERRKYDIFNNLQSHRNYFDHLDRIQPCFKGKIGSYILLKCELLFRIYILKDLNISINTDKLKENIKSIERRFK